MFRKRWNDNFPDNEELDTLIKRWNDLAHLPSSPSYHYLNSIERASNSPATPKPLEVNDIDPEAEFLNMCGNRWQVPELPELPDYHPISSMHTSVALSEPLEMNDNNFEIIEPINIRR